jgi:sugar (pentulose or hexulose) kinase
MTRDLLLAVDNGTQSVRALLFDAVGNLVAKTRVALDDYSSPQPGWHEHDAGAFWRAVCDTCQALWQEYPELRDRVAGVAVTTQRGTVINLDANGHPLRPAITWLDQRKAGELPRISPVWRAAFAAAGVSSTIRYFQREAEANWIREHQPDVWRATHKYVLLSGFLLYKFCGRFVDSIGSQVAYIPFDYKRLRWASSSDWKWQALRIDRDLLPELVPPATVLGRITEDAAAQTGIPLDTPIVAAAADKACEVLGAGSIGPGIACLSYGTTATINVTTPRYLEATPFIPPYPAALPNSYDVEVQIFRGFWMVSWFKEQFGVWGDDLIAGVPPGSMGLMLQPYWSPGLKNPGPEAKGAIIGFGDVHTRAHMYRAILEGLAFALREGKERVERRGRLAISTLRVAGGGSQSDAAMQITANVFGLPAERPHVYEASGLGAAICCAVGLGMHASYESAVQAMTRIERTFEPIPENRRVYDALYDRVYHRMYAHLRPLYAEIRKITGYPEE